MADPQLYKPTLPLDDPIWDAWLEKNRAADEHFDAIFPWYACSIAAVLLALVVFWTSRPL